MRGLIALLATFVASPAYASVLIDVERATGSGGVKTALVVLGVIAIVMLAKPWKAEGV